MSYRRDPRIHELKCWPAQFQATWDGQKLYEWRRDDGRDFAQGDITYLLEWDEYRTKDDLALRDQVPLRYRQDWRYTGRGIRTRVTWITRGFGVPEGYCVLGFEVLDRDEMRGGELWQPAKVTP